MRLGSWPAWTVTSRVAKSWFLGWSPLSPVSALIRVVFPEQEHNHQTETTSNNMPALVHWTWSGQAAASHHSLCIPARRRRGTLCVSSEIAAGVSSSAVSPAPSESSSLAPSAASAGPRTASHLQTQSTRLSADQSSSLFTIHTHTHRHAVMPQHLSLRCTSLLHLADPCLQIRFSDEICK